MWARTARIAAGAGLVAGLLAFGLTGSGRAAQLTPTPIDAGECRVAPRVLPLWNGTPPSTSELERPDPVAGEPADAATIRGITATITESIACANAGQPLRALSLVSDDFLARQFVGPAAADVTEAGALLSRPEEPPAPSDYLGIVAIEDVVVFEDDRIGAVVVTANAEGRFEDYVVLIEAEVRWLIDASYTLATNYATPDA